ncbi:MAG: hypothetical protein Ct9H300mP13_6410 [Gammaproteobacteria bacterium]|nr:MAG: hypothetical protein Ct9H300mP13_6410 [Gammaproteobacteria bacterium]
MWWGSDSFGSRTSVGVPLTLFSPLSVIPSSLAQISAEEQRRPSKLSQRGKRYIGRTVRLGKVITNGIGKVQIEDTLWRARGADAAVGEQVKIVAIEGATFEVEASRQSPANQRSDWCKQSTFKGYLFVGPK